MKNDFRVVIPAQLNKSDDGEWHIQGVASDESVDRQGEVLLQSGFDMSTIDKKRGYFNNDHKSGISNLLGPIDSYKFEGKKLIVKGRLFKNVEKSKAMYNIMSSLDKAGDAGRVGMSVEGSILKRNERNPNIIEKAKINAIALTLNPVNETTVANLMKSMSEAEVDFDIENKDLEKNEHSFSMEQVIDIVGKTLNKALGVGAGYTQAPNTMTDGAALSQEELADDAKKVESQEKKKKKIKKMDKCMYKSLMLDVLEQLQILYPEYSRTAIWESVKDRIESKYENINE